MNEHPSYVYASAVVNREISAPKYAKKQAQIFVDICDGKSEKYCINTKRVKQIDNLLKLLIMPKGLKAGKSIYETSTGYQWLFYISVLCVVYREDLQRRRYETVILEIARKNFKTFTIATLFIILLLLEPKFSKFYSVAPDGALSREVKSAIEEILKSSPLIYEHKNKKRFKILRDYIECYLNENRYIPLNTSRNRMDGKLPAAFLADEVAALPTSYPIEAMRSGQINIKNKLGCIISTKYETFDNPFEDEVAYFKKILDGIELDDTYFGLLYEPDDTKNWATDDEILKQANPAALENPEIWEDLLKKRARAIAIPSARANFLTKHCNIIYQGIGTENFIDVAEVQKCKVDKIDWRGRTVYLGVDLSMSNDNCSVAMAADGDDGSSILADVVAFIPEGRIEEKNEFEKVDYRQFVETMKCIACGDKTVDYAVIEQFVFDIEKTYGVSVAMIGYDRYNALSSAQKWEGKYTTVQVRQHSDTLHPATKLLYEKIMNGEFQYEENKLLEINFQNAKCVYDTNMNRYVNKKRSNGKVDMVVSLLNAVYLLNTEVFLNNRNNTSYFI